MMRLLAVKIALNKPLVSQFLLDGKIQKIEYESLPTICFECGKYGHVLSKCPEKHKTTDQIESTMKEHALANVEDKVAVSSRTGSSTSNAMYDP